MTDAARKHESYAQSKFLGCNASCHPNPRPGSYVSGDKLELNSFCFYQNNMCCFNCSKVKQCAKDAAAAGHTMKPCSYDNFDLDEVCEAAV